MNLRREFEIAEEERREVLRLAAENDLFKKERREGLKLAGIFVGFGAVIGLLRDESLIGLLVGSVAGAMLFGLVCGVGWLCVLLQRIDDAWRNYRGLPR